MKDFISVQFRATQCQRELNKLGRLLESRHELGEDAHLKPLFRKARQLSAFMGIYAGIGPANLLSYEFGIAGDFCADFVLGNRQSQTYCLVEFEDGGLNSIFTAAGRKTTSEWSRRFDHGFSQLVDWFCALDDLKDTGKLAKVFGYGHVKFHGLLVIGRSSGLSDGDLRRLRWRSERVLINSHPVQCITYDQMHQDLSLQLYHYRYRQRRV
jgi:Domain of unknown function (DUF4263)